MGCYNLNKLYDPYRGKWVVETPEEQVRQKVIAELVFLGYPKSLISVEKSVVDQTSYSSANRRFDILCSTKHNEGLIPLLLIECKDKTDMSAIAQVVGYNERIGAPFVCIASKDLRFTQCAHPGFLAITWDEEIPSFNELNSYIS